MATAQKINLGIVGVGGRGGGFNRATGPIDSIRIHAVCDTDAERLEEAAGSLGASEAFADYGEMLASPDLEAVLIGTPMPYHAAQAIAALERGIHVLSEVPAAVSDRGVPPDCGGQQTESGDLHDGRELLLHAPEPDR